MSYRFFMRTAATAGILALSLLSCDDPPVTVGEGKDGCCGNDSGPSYLRSKLDDDDGDGNPFDEDYPAIDDEDDDIADHAWIRDSAGAFHLFFQNEGFDGGSDIEHYVSDDLRSLQYVGRALSRIPGTWDADGLWAPHMVQSGGMYFMFYTGVEGAGASAMQRIGVATSPDLVTWTRLPSGRCAGAVGDGCLYDCDEDWTTWSGPADAFNQQCRDPFVMWDASLGRWLLFATARSTNTYGVVTVARSANLFDWTGEGFIDATRRLDTGSGGQTTGGQAENPYVTSYGGNHYLFFTDWQDPEDSVTVAAPRTIVQYATSATLSADTAGSAAWTYRGYIPDPGVNAIEIQYLGGLWLMSQSISNPRAPDHEEHRRELRLRCIAWENNLGFDTANPNLDCVE